MSASIQSISLSGSKKQVSNKEMTFLERLYLIAILKGLWITIKHFFRKKATIQYPEQVREFSPVYRGQHMLKRDEFGRENCTACGLCALSCPAEAITMKAAERKKGGLGVVLGQHVKDDMDVALHTALTGGPLGAGNMRGKGRDLKVVFNVDGEGVGDHGSVSG